ncbi:hypothetical protein P879_05728 [Paragonimus westermani]|uniref:Uncharacterized protein n=1 Tax=Paragonimus westermani TaxID=34504 RepID=A0A8T0D386_9TREM|nr:hypothetical protein P879_05728 [Paragonimus westermani]
MKSGRTAIEVPSPIQGSLELLTSPPLMAPSFGSVHFAMSALLTTQFEETSVQPKVPAKSVEITPGLKHNWDNYISP